MPTRPGTSRPMAVETAVEPTPVEPKRLTKKEYEKELARLQAELVRLQ